jgi:hypothetical protein
VRKLAHITGAELLLFCIVDDHVHIVIKAERARAGYLARSIRLSLRPIAASHIEPAHKRPVAERSHMQWLVKYLLAQPKRHEIAVHSALWGGSCFQDLVGARIIEGMRLQLGTVLPRFRVQTAYEAVGLPPREIPPAQDSAVRVAGAARLVSATGAALAVGPSLAGKTESLVHARRAIAQIARDVGISSSEIAWALGVTRRTAGRLLGQPVEEKVLHAIRRRLAIENVVFRLTSANRGNTRPV